MTPKAAVETDSRLAARCAAIASAGAGLIHFAVMPVHFLAWVPAGLFFAVVAVLQLGWAYLVWSRPWPSVFAVGIAANVGTAALWVVSRTAGLPFGPHADAPDTADTAGICLLLLECYVVMGAAWAWLQDFEPEGVSRVRSAMVLVAANAVIGGTVFVAVASSFQDDDHRAPMEAQRNGPTDVRQHRGDLVGPPNSTTTPSPEAGDASLPVTDMALHPGDRDHP